MHFSTVFIVLAAAVSFVSASPVVSPIPDSCSILDCAEALGPSIASCATAALDEGLNPSADAKCLADAVSAGSTAPSACQGCF